MRRSGEPPLSFPPVLRLAASLRASTAVPGPCLSNKQDLSATLVPSALPFPAFWFHAPSVLSASLVCVGVEDC